MLSSTCDQSCQQKITVCFILIDYNSLLINPLKNKNKNFSMNVKMYDVNALL